MRGRSHQHVFPSLQRWQCARHSGSLPPYLSVYSFYASVCLSVLRLEAVSNPWCLATLPGLCQNAGLCDLVVRLLSQTASSVHVLFVSGLQTARLYFLFLILTSYVFLPFSPLCLGLYEPSIWGMGKACIFIQEHFCRRTAGFACGQTDSAVSW